MCSNSLENLFSCGRSSAEDVCEVDGCPHRAVVDAGQRWRVEGGEAEQVGHVKYSQGDGGAGQGASSLPLLERTTKRSQ